MSVFPRPNSVYVPILYCYDFGLSYRPGLANMIWAAVITARPEVELTQTKVVGLFIGLLIVHGLLNSVGTKLLARSTSSFVFVNLGSAISEFFLLDFIHHLIFIIVIIIVLLATTPRAEMHEAKYVFGMDGIINNTGGWNTGLAFLFGLLSVQWTVSSSLSKYLTMDHLTLSCR